MEPNDCARIPHLYERQLGLPDLLVDEVVVVLGRDVEAVALLGVELGGVQHDRDLALEHDEHLANFLKSTFIGENYKVAGNPTMVFLSVQLMPLVEYPLILRKERRW